MGEEIKDKPNFTCGKCMNVVPYDKDYKCPHCDVVKKEDKEGEK